MKPRKILHDTIQYLEMKMVMMEKDFDNKEYGELAKMLHHHYNGIWSMLTGVKSPKKDMYPLSKDVKK